MASKETFVLYKSYLQKTERLSNEQLGILFRAILRHESGLDLPEMDALTEMAFDFIRVDLDSNAEKYDEECERNRKNANKRWHKEDATAFDRIQPHTKDATASEWMPTDTDSDTESESDNKNKYIERETRKRFVPPTEEEVEAYRKEKGYDVDPAEFVNFYASKGWMVGKNKMVDWHRSLAGWASRQAKSKSPPKKKFVNFDQHDYDFDDIERKLALMQGAQ